MRWTDTILVIIITMSLVQEDNGAALAPPIKKLRKAMKVGQTVNLPAPAVVGGTSLTEALADRRSIRSYTNQILTSLEISQLLWATQGVTNDKGYRTAPSAGAKFPLELYLVTNTGHYHYEPDEHSLTVMGTEDPRKDLSDASLYQDEVKEAPAVFVVAAVYERTAEKYGSRRSGRYVMLEAGHACQNLLLQAVALGLGGVPMGAFYDDKVQDALGLPLDHAPLYVVPIGHPS